MTFGKDDRQTRAVVSYVPIPLLHIRTSSVFVQYFVQGSACFHGFRHIE